MGLDFVNFLDALATFMAAGASLVYVASGNTPRSLFRNQAVEDFATDPYSVLRIYDGTLPYVPVPDVSIQCETIGQSKDAALTQAQLLFGTLTDSNGKPLRMAQIAAVNSGPVYRINGVTPHTPGLIGVDDRNRNKIVFNFQVKFVPLS